MKIGWPTNNKEWRMLVAIIIFIEFILLHFIYSAGENKDFINLFSFGATIVSIILALVAIFYTFLQVESQRQDSQHLSTQINVLERVAGSLKSGQASVSGLIEKVEKDYQNLSEQITPIAKAIDNLTNLPFEKADKSASPVSTNTDDKIKLIEMSSKTKYGALFTYVISKITDEHEMPIKKLIMGIFIPAAQTSETIEKIFFIGIAGQIYRTFLSNQIITINNKCIVVDKGSDLQNKLKECASTAKNDYPTETALIDDSFKS